MSCCLCQSSVSFRNMFPNVLSIFLNILFALPCPTSPLYSSSNDEIRIFTNGPFHIQYPELEILQHQAFFLESLEHSKDTKMSITCSELGVTFTNDPPFDVLGLPECGNRVSPILHLYLPGGFDCELDAFNLPNRKTRLCFETLNEKISVKKIVILIHGFLKSFKDPWLHEYQANIMKLDPGTAVIIVGWGGGIFDLFKYWQSAANTRYVSTAMYEIIKELRRIVYSRDFYIHCIGHSLGGHACGLLGKLLVENNDKPLNRISGLDPAGPLFCNDVPYPFDRVNARKEARLGPEYADFVDVIHTDGHARYFGYIPQYGTLERLGMIDFYPGTNGLYGQDQPGCDNVFDVVSCSHARAHEIYGSSIDDAVCEASRICKGDPHVIPKNCSYVGKKIITMGYWIDPNSFSPGEYTVESSAKPPFCL